MDTTYIKLAMFAVLGFVLFEFLKLLGWFKTDKADQVSKSSLKQQLKEEKFRKNQETALKIIHFLGEKQGVKEGTSRGAMLDNSLKRLQVTAFNKVLSVYEFKGLVFCILVGSILVSLFLLFVNKFVILIPVLLTGGIIIFFFYQMLFDMIINERDKILSEQFSDFFLMVYSSIVSPTGATLIDTVKTYKGLLDYKLAMNSDLSSTLNEIYSLTSTYLALLGQQNELTATRYLKDRYSTSSLVVNFCALVEQRLMGVDNVERLASFRNELLQKKKQKIKDKSEKILEKGTLLIRLIYVILIQTVILASIANFPFLANYINR